MAASKNDSGPTLHADGTFRFGPFVVNGRERMLTRDDQETPLQSKSFDTLLFLLSNAGHLVRKDEFFAAVWPDVIVSDNSLTRCIKEVRHALDDQSGEPHYIQTVRGAGYKFIADVTMDATDSTRGALTTAVASNATSQPHAESAISRPPATLRPGNTADVDPALGTPAGVQQSSDSDAAAPRQPGAFANTRYRTVWLGAAILLAALAFAFQSINRDRAPTPPAGNSIAVLAFENFTGDPEQDAFCDGLSEELLNRLAGVEGLTVTARTSAFSLKGKSLDIPAIASLLDVRYVLEGSVRKDADDVRVTAQLVDNHGFHLWSQQYDRTLTRIFAVQEDIAHAVSDRLELQILGRQAATKRQYGTENTQAYLAFLSGMGHFHSYHSGGMQKAQALFERAIELDPDFAEAHAYAAMALLPRAVRLPGTDVARATELATRALSLDENLAEGYAALAAIEIYRSDWAAAAQPRIAEYLDKALALRPSLLEARNWQAILLATQGKLDEALALRQAAALADPLHVAVQSNLALSFLKNGQADEAEARFTEIAGLPHAPDYTFVMPMDSNYFLGRFNRALHWGLTGLAAMPESPDLAIRLAIILAHLGLETPAGVWVDSAGGAQIRADLLGIYAGYLIATGHLDALALIAQQAEDMLRNRFRIPQPDWPLDAVKLLVNAKGLSGDFDKVIQIAGPLYPDGSYVTGWRADFQTPSHIVQWLAFAYQQTGAMSAAQELLNAIDRETATRRRHGFKGHPSLTITEALNRAMRGDVVGAVNKLQQAVAEGFRAAAEWQTDIRLGPVRDDPGFAALIVFIEQDVARMRAEAEADESLIPILHPAPQE